MLQTEFNDGSGSKLVISWDASIDVNESASETIRDCDDLVGKVNHLYETISAFSAEFVQCMRQIHRSKHEETAVRDALNLSFQISDTSAKHSSDEISRLHLEIDKLQRENRRLETDLKCKIKDLSGLEEAHEQDKRQLRNKYQKEMSDLRIYFEKFCHDNYERDITSNLRNHKREERKSSSNSDDGAEDQAYEETNCIRFDNVDNNCSNPAKETVGSDLKMFIVRAYEAQVHKFQDNFNTRKDEEMERLKEDNLKFSNMIETLKNEISRLVREKTMENNVRAIQREVKQRYEEELEELQDVSDNEFLRKMNNDKVTLEKEFKRKFENALNELNDEWEKKIEVLSELLVRSAIKSVSLEETNLKINEEKEMLRMKLHECMTALPSGENVTNIEEFAERLLKMRDIHACEIDDLQKENVSLRNKIEDLQQRVPPANCSREKVITMLIEEIADLISKEEYGENVTWPPELAALENVFSRKLHPPPNVESPEPSQCFPQFENDGAGERLDHSLDQNQLLEGRNGLRKVNIALNGVINMFTRYLTNCEEECNNSLIGALINAEKLKKNLDTIDCEGSASDIDFTAASIDEETGSVRFPSNLSDFVNLLDVNDRVNTSGHDRNVSVTENDLKAWLQLLKTEASTVLQLISNQKHDARPNRDESVKTASTGTDNRTKGVQTALSGKDIDHNEEKMTVLQHSLQKAENALCELQEKASYLAGFIKPTESLEGYGEANRSISPPTCVLNVTGGERLDEERELDSDAVRDPEYYCAKCDDLQKQMKYVQNLLEQNRKHLERQALERDTEREEYDKQLKSIVVERDIHLSSKEKFKYEATLLEQQVKELTGKLEEDIEHRNTLETKLRSMEKQLRTLREESIELKERAASRSEFAAQVEKKLKFKEEELRTVQTNYQKLLDELDKMDEIRTRQVQEFSEAHVSSSNVCDKMKKELMEIERIITARTRMLENSAVVSVAASALSSPSASISEDISCEQPMRLFSPNGSDSSSPGRNRISFDILSCLHDKLNKLFRAEEASCKKIRDQEMQLSKIVDDVKTLELERNMLNQSLRATSDELSQRKRELENWRVGVGQHASPYQSTIQLELTARIRKLQSEIKHYKEYLTQKDDCDATFMKAVSSLQTIVSSLQFDEKEEMEKRLRKLLARFEQLEQEKRIRQQRLAFLEDDTSENDGTPKRKMRRLARCEAFTPADGKNDLRRSRVSFADNLESYSPDADVTRRAPAAVVSPVPRITSAAATADDSFSNKMPHHNLNKSTSFFDAKSLNIRPNLVVEQIPVAEMQDLASYDSISLDSNAAACGSSIEGNGEKSQDSSSIADESSTDKGEIHALRDSLEREKKRHRKAFSTLRQLKRLNSPQVKDELRDLVAAGDETENGVNSSKEQFLPDEAEKGAVLALMAELKTSVAIMRQLEQSLRKVESTLADEVELYKNECQESKNVCQAVIRERIEAEKRCEELQARLCSEKLKSAEFSAALESVRNEVAGLQAALDSETELVQSLTRANENMKKELERPANQPTEKEELSTSKVSPESLRDLAEKVQKEVELAVQLDDHLLKNLKSTSASSSLLNSLLKISSTLSPDLKRVLFKILQDGCENLMAEDKRVLIESFHLVDASDLQQLQETNKELVAQVESERLVVKDLLNEQSFLHSEIGRLETVLAYYEERMSFLASKVDDYRNRYVKNEIELTGVRCSRTQLECQLLTLRKECNGLKSQQETQVQKHENEMKAVMKENVDLKQNIDTLKNQVEALTAEMNSIKAISQYHSNSEAELSRTLYPLKSRLDEVQKKYSRVKVDFEIAVGQLEKLRFDLKIERMQNQQLEERQKSLLLAKREVEENLIEVRMKYDDLVWQKQRVDDKLSAFELTETRKRKVRMERINLTKEENEAMQRQLEGEYERLRLNVFKVRDNFVTLHYSWRKVCEKYQTLCHRMLRAEKNQRALVYQKNYFINRGCYETTLITPCRRKFKSVVVAVMSLRRMQFLASLRLEHGRQVMLKSLTDELPNVKVYPWFDFTVDLPDGMDGGSLSNESERNIEDVEFALIDDSLKALHAQFQTLLNKWD